MLRASGMARAARFVGQHVLFLLALSGLARGFVGARRPRHLSPSAPCDALYPAGSCARIAPVALSRLRRGSRTRRLEPWSHASPDRDPTHRRAQRCVLRSAHSCPLSACRRASLAEPPHCRCPDRPEALFDSDLDLEQTLTRSRSRSPTSSASSRSLAARTLSVSVRVSPPDVRLRLRANSQPRASRRRSSSPSTRAPPSPRRRRRPPSPTP